MMKRLAIIAALSLSLLPGDVLADLDGTRRMDRDNRRCQSIGRQVERRGMTVREQARLTKHHCKKSGGVWVSDLFYQA